MTSLKEFKELIAKLAIKARWRFDQLQHAEDYIDAIHKDGTNAAVTAGLDTNHAETIMEQYRKFAQTA